ncbi:hypothetical protein [Pseudomonas sp. GM48]|uniref:hypothetical protein n=1 Tax=Pseudomonas sp. GM48 TaxID=1144330 RepID=UPI00026FFF4B|nr:hypothetical protein [Pseudomonas sp. GM48]EJM58447.1 hypothetical protein PMI28_02161 [Pseudomonas sp. GM48]
MGILKENLFEPKKLLRLTIFLFLAFLFYFGFYIFAVTDTPIYTEGELLTTEGKFIAIAASTQRGTSFVIKERSDGSLKKFHITSGYTEVKSGFSSSIGRKIIVQHYNRQVVSCKIDGIEFCVSNCVGKYECEMKVYRASVSALKIMVYTVAVLFFVSLVAYLIKRKRQVLKE